MDDEVDQLALGRDQQLFTLKRWIERVMREKAVDKLGTSAIHTDQFKEFLAELVLGILTTLAEKFNILDDRLADQDQVIQALVSRYLKNKPVD